MKVFIDKLMDNGVQLLQTLLVIVVALVPFCLNIQGLQALLGGFAENNKDSLNYYLLYKAVSHGKILVSILLVIFVVWKIRGNNSNAVMNQRGCYHNYPYCWYWYCAKILGFRKCNLVLVPIHTQFKLIIRGLFDDYPMNDTDFPEIQEESITVKKKNEECKRKEINLILEDTYPITEMQIPETKRSLKSITISRHDGETMGRHFSQQFVESVINIARGLPDGCIVNVFATTNPKNTENIARRAFMTADRGNIIHLYVFQQMKTPDRVFGNKGSIIY